MKKTKLRFFLTANILFLIVETFMCRPIFAIEYEGRALRDPFIPVLREIAANDQIVPIQPEQSLSLEGMVWNSDYPQAVINGGVVKIGSKIGSAQVVSIEKNGVTLRDGERTFVLRPKGRGAT